MSSQPSTVESIKDTANSVASTVTSSAQDSAGYNPNKDPANFAQDAHGNTFKKGDYKDQLNRAATEGLNKGDPKPDTLLDTVRSYIPGLGAPEKPKDEKTPVKTDVPPNRPDHDGQVEQFLRKQYHSKAGEGMPDPTKE